MAFDYRQYTLNTMGRYWPLGGAPVAGLPIPEAVGVCQELTPFDIVLVELPIWAKEAGVNGQLAIPENCIAEKVTSDLWQCVDWFSAMFLLLNGHLEQYYEQRHGPIHSYSARLSKIPSVLWDRAWVNRIAIFLRLWCGQFYGKDVSQLLGAMPKAKIYLTHDVDAIEKTLAIRLKQTAFCLFNVMRSLIRCKPKKAIDSLKRAFNFLFSSDSYDCFDRILKIESMHNIKSSFNFYAGVMAKFNVRQWLMDPSYDVSDAQLSAKICNLRRQGHAVGLHQGFDTWRDNERMQREHDRLSAITRESISSCRQHWLRFSWAHTWRAQALVGLRLDTSLGFNDRAGFRNSAAVRFCPFHRALNHPLSIEVLPLVLMDSHLYDYGNLSESQIKNSIDNWLDEVFLVGGEASIVWHQRVFSQDYGWSLGYEYLLGRIATQSKQHKNYSTT